MKLRTGDGTKAHTHAHAPSSLSQPEVKSTPGLEYQLRDAAEKGDEAALTALLDAKIVNINGGDEVSVGEGEVVVWVVG